ncbi:MAG: hypothetical protein NZ602_15135 [Thermoguttaceae bacterium]|nr:hypothetical protein [Thermoguttaceae bacterium]MDW8039523.1 hypothetical protein [Thermoguttaceae bacterium]
MRRVCQVLLVVGLVLAMGGLLLAAEGKRPRGPRPEGGPPEFGRMDPFPLVKRIQNLSEEQKQKIENLRKEYEPKLSELREKLDAIITPEQKKAREEAIKKAKEEGKTGRELFEAIRNAVKLTEEQQNKMKEVQTQIGQLAREIRGKLDEILTEEQRAQLRRFGPGRGGRPKGKPEGKQ